ncbi:MAG: DUF86 domain-containing protein [Clostridia bacterium]|jgi:uncharacterized protein with HEPN domain|nr:DUF86 domain-containing protein [Clostridia bacterium]
MIRSRDPLPYLQDILDCITRIKRYTQEVDVEAFMNNEILQDAIVRRIEIIGEAVGCLPDSLKSRYPDIPWQDIKDMRNKLIHDYGHVDLELVWGVVQNEIPELEIQVRRVMDEYIC